MSVDLALDKTGLQYLIYMLTRGYNLRIVIRMLDNNHRGLQSLSWRFYDGQINIDATADITRSASLVLWDIDRSLNIDTVNPGVGALYYDKMIQIYYCVWRTGDARSIDIPVFTGPITDFKRQGAFVNLELMGKELLSQNVIWTPIEFAAGYNKAKAIRGMLNAAGEAKMKMITSSAKLPKTLSLGREAIPWTESKKVASSMSLQLFYDGRGIAQLRQVPGTIGLTLQDGNGGGITSEPNISYNLSEVRNKIWVKGSTASISATATAPSTHPLNPYRIGRVGIDGINKPRVLLEVIEDSNITSDSEAQAKANSVLTQRLVQAIDVDLGHVPMPFAEERDLMNVVMQDQYVVPFRMNQMSIPLVGGTESSFGSTKNLALKRRN